jgi:hypothetical protein
MCDTHIYLARSFTGEVAVCVVLEVTLVAGGVVSDCMCDTHTYLARSFSGEVAVCVVPYFLGIAPRIMPLKSMKIVH